MNPQKTSTDQHQRNQKCWPETQRGTCCWRQAGSWGSQRRWRAGGASRATRGWWEGRSPPAWLAGTGNPQGRAGSFPSPPRGWYTAGVFPRLRSRLILSSSQKHRNENKMVSFDKMLLVDVQAKLTFVKQSRKRKEALWQILWTEKLFYFLNKLISLFLAVNADAKQCPGVLKRQMNKKASKRPPFGCVSQETRDFLWCVANYSSSSNLVSSHSFKKGI